jgi:hypothetical protein
MSNLWHKILTLEFRFNFKGINIYLNTKLNKLLVNGLVIDLEALDFYFEIFGQIVKTPSAHVVALLDHFIQKSTYFLTVLDVNDIF